MSLRHIDPDSMHVEIDALALVADTDL